MTVILAPQLTNELEAATVTVSELAALQSFAGIEELPVALQVPLASESAHHIDNLSRRGLVTDGYVHPDLADWLRTLMLAEHEVTIRRIAVAQPERMVISWGGRRGSPVGAVRTGDIIRIAAITGAPAAPLRRFLGSVPAMRVRDVRAPREDLLEALGMAGEPAGAESAFRRLGVPAQDARRLVDAFSRLTGMSEIVAGAPRAGSMITSGVFDTPIGRLMTIPACPGDPPWLTLCGGSDARISALLKGLCWAMPTGS
ncbi:ESX secretion-associated protein EspG [Hoyosella subflava]|uniref:ESX secretion-associated protein EspG n=1 Tax=Hoyosella subflava (strain DSM 45089 / JCM 17490 / NBRC 109087 / DQS3-9A1) TaxID=443218 RepID=F6EE94_HOYSD|nr:ESX secretion-associated protein EspG [Hoyosella subflava]AEF38546.1 hypothetical protein AS9A_0086 [Hoyosella subflava DQS3-9A1]